MSQGVGLQVTRGSRGWLQGSRGSRGRPGYRVPGSLSGEVRCSIASTQWHLMGLANSLFPRQLDEDGSRPWKWNFESSDSDHTLVIVKRNSSVSSPCHHVIVWLKFSGNSPHPPFKCSIVLSPSPESKLSDFLFTECELFDWRLQRYRPLHLCYLQWIDMKMIMDCC